MNDKAMKLLETADRLQQDMQAAWQSSKPSLIDIYDKRAKHCETIASLYIELLKAQKEV